MENEGNTMKNFLGSTGFGDSKLSKDNELNETMSITPQSPDEFENKNNNLGGNE